MKTSVWALLALIACPGFATAQQSTYICAGNGREIQQLRIYELNRDNRDHFHQRFQDEALRIMKKYNFRVLDIWESDYRREAAVRLRALMAGSRNHGE